MTPYAPAGAPNLLLDPLTPSVVLIDDQPLINVHSVLLCAGHGCAIHHPSNHPMATWPLRPRIRYGVLTVERVCEHGIAHPDYDDVLHVARRHGAQEGLLHTGHPCCPHVCCTSPTFTQLIKEAR